MWMAAYRAVDEQGQVLDALDVDAETVGSESIQNRFTTRGARQCRYRPPLLQWELPHTRLHHKSFLPLGVSVAIQEVQPDDEHGKADHDGLVSCKPAFRHHPFSAPWDVPNLVSRFLFWLTLLH
jgi:hypothetical protein